jgi:poly(3-hydroxybutyrate) depolymerase
MATSRTTSTSRDGSRRAAIATAAAAVLALLPLSAQASSHRTAVTVTLAAPAAAPDSRQSSRKLIDDVRTWPFTYRTHKGNRRHAYLVLPAWYGPGNNPPLPVIISPHGRGGNGLANSKFFGRLPAVGRFAVINPDGMGRNLKSFSYGARGQIDDLARMPRLATAAFPWLELDRSRVYALGSSMGGQETLLLVARHPNLLAGAAALDSVTDLTRRHGQMPALDCPASCLERWGKPYGEVLQSTLEREVGGSPSERPHAYAARSGLSLARTIVASRVPLQIWWSTEDQIVSDQEHQSGALFERIRELDRCADVTAVVGSWQHSKEMRAAELLPIALRRFGLLPHSRKQLPRSVRTVPALPCADRSDR